MTCKQRYSNVGKGDVPHPFIRWPGGKFIHANALLNARPPQFNVYHEPFLGGGALFFALWRANLLRSRFPSAVLSDIDPFLIETFAAVRARPVAVMNILDKLLQTKWFHRALASLPAVALSRTGRAARFIYLTKTSYGAMLKRVAEDGHYDGCILAGHGVNVTLYERGNILAASRALRTAMILCASYETVLQRAKPGDWVYFDPPYLGTCNTLYPFGGFTKDDHANLAKVFSTLADKGVHVMLTNIDTPFVRSLYRGYYVTKRISTNWLSQKRTKAQMHELIITSYPVKYPVTAHSART